MVSTLHGKQINLLIRLSMIQFVDLMYVPAPVLLVKATGGGKALVCDIHSVMFRGISLTIVPPIALGVEQTSESEN